MSTRRRNKKEIANHHKEKLTKEATGVKFEPRTPGQFEYVRCIAENVVTVCTGPAGTGKTAIASAIASQYIKDGDVKKIILARPTIETAPRSLGALPGKYEEKVGPFMRPLIIQLKKFMGITAYNNFSSSGSILVEPLEYMRGMNYHESFMILDEAQNCTYEQLKMFITRFGYRSKIVVCGDVKQNDLQGYDNTPLQIFIDKLQTVYGVGTIKLNKSDIVRNKLISSILTALGD